MKATKVASMSVEEIQTATAELKKVRQAMGFSLPLSPAERAACGRLGTKTAQITQMRLAAAQQHKEVLPPSFDLRQFERETALLVALSQCLDAVKSIQSDVHDTFLAIGKGAVQSAKFALGHLQVGAEANETLKDSVRFITRKRTRAPRAATPQNTAAATPGVPAPGAEAGAAPAAPPVVTPPDAPVKKAA